MNHLKNGLRKIITFKLQGNKCALNLKSTITEIVERQGSHVTDSYTILQHFKLRFKVDFDSYGIKPNYPMKTLL